MSAVPRIVTIWIPDWPVVAAGVAGDAPVAVLNANRVVARSAAAAQEGVVIGQRRRQAQRRCPEVVLLEHDLQRDAREFESVVRAVAELAPRFDVVEPGWIALAARGPSRYFGGDERLADRLGAVVTEVVRAGVERHGDPPGGRAVPGIGIADGRFSSGIAARLAARREVPVIVEPGGSGGFCAPLPIGWLQTLGEAEPELVDLFMRLGLRRLGDLAVLPASDVLGRFGPVGAHAHRLAAGGDVRPSSTADPAPERRLTRVLEDPAAQREAVVFVAKQLADELAETLAAEGRVCTRLVVLLETEHGERSERSWYRSGGLSAPAMVERVRWQLDGWTSRGEEITAGVALVRLTPDEVRADDGDQLGLWGGESDNDRRAARAIARLSTLTSEQAVTVPVWQGGRLPGDRYRWVPAVTVDLDQRRRAVSHAGTGSGEAGPWPGCLPPPSPATVLAEPRPVEVIDPAGTPITVSGRGVLSGRPAVLRPLAGSEEAGWRRGRPRAITAWAGPWPVEERWWEPDRHRRLARFQMLTDDGRAHLVVAEHRRWWISAIYD
jgi:protein ImuB